MSAELEGTRPSTPSARLPIIPTLLEAGELIIARAGTLLACFWFPWLVAVIISSAIEAWTTRAGIDFHLAWLLRDIAWAPFSAMIGVMVLRTLLHGEPPRRVINLDFSRETALTIPVLVVWFLGSTALTPVRGSLPPEMMKAFGASGEWDATAQSIWYGVKLATWLAEAAVVLGLYGLVAIIVDTGRIDGRANDCFIAQAPIRLFCLILVGGIITAGLYYVNGSVRTWLGLHFTFDEFADPAKAWTGPFLNYLVSFPAWFISYMLGDLTLAIVYKRLAPRAGIVSRHASPA